MLKIRLNYLLIIVIFSLLSACGGRNSAQSSSNDYDISVEAGSTTVGKTDLMVTVKDQNGTAINDATVRIKGDMSHAGMQPVLGESATASNGVYTIPYEWTMAGDWFVTIDVTFADGSTATERFDFNGISGDDMDEMDHSDMDMDEEMDHGEMDMEESDQ